MGMVRLDGNTFPVREGLKALGARWDRHSQCWMIAQELARDAMALIATAPEPSRFRRMIPREKQRKTVRDESGRRVDLSEVERDDESR